MKNKIIELKELLSSRAQISIVSHTNPDGDAIGSGLALTKILMAQGHNVRFMVPNNYPYFLEWMSGIELIHIYKVETQECDTFIEESDIVFCVDFNNIERLEGLGSRILANTHIKRVLVDHHLMPPDEYDISLSDMTASSTSLIVYRIAVELGLADLIDLSVAESLYVGISTDTGNFSFGNLTPEVYRVVAHLIECGINVTKLNISIYNNFSIDRMRLMGYVLDKKMKIIEGRNIAYMSLTAEELKNYNFRPGDSEGFVNLPLVIKDINMSVMFTETADCIKVSLRSQGDIDVNLFARKYFNGGGHKNASGGRYVGSLESCIAEFVRVVELEV